MLSASFVHLQQLISQVETLKARSGVQRVAEFLLELAEDEAGRGEGRRVTLPYNKALIAARLGMQPETLSRAFARLREHGVTIDSSTARIADLGALQDLCDEAPRPAGWRG